MRPGVSSQSDQNARAQQALELLQHGRRVEAEALLNDVIKIQPRHFHALHLLGLVSLEKQDGAGASTFLQAATAVNPHAAAAHSNLAVALLFLRRPGEALHCCDRALAIQPLYAEAHANRGEALRALARFAEALSSFEEALEQNPSLVAAQTGRGRTLFDLCRYEEALAQFERFLKRYGPSAVALNDLARALLRLRRPQEALAAWQEALRCDPVSVDVLANRGSALRELQQPDEALASYWAALRLDSRRADVHSNIGNLLLHLGRPQEALVACENALALDPRLIEACDIRAQALRSLGRLEEALLTQRALLGLDPDHPYALGKFLHTKAALCDWLQQDELAARVDAGILAGERLCTPMIYLSLSGSPAAQWRCARTYLADVLPEPTELAGVAAYTHDRIRIAYVSADFRDHPVAHLLAGVLEQHDRKTFEVHGISIDPERRDDPTRVRIVKAVERFHDAAQRSDRDVAALLRELEIDVLIDLGGHTRGSRLGIFANRPAPIQVSFLGFMGTTGANFIDYVIGDSTALPARLQPFFSERIVHLPHCFLPNDDAQRIAESSCSREEAGLPQAAFVFCAFSSPYKLNASMFAVWMHLLDQVPGSILWLKDGETSMRESLRARALSRQIDPSRLIFAPRVTSMSEHLARYRLADLFLDTSPYGAHATARDALWAGLPVITCAGEAFASRVAASLLRGVGLEELITADIKEYTARAISLAQEPATLAVLRAKLAANCSAGPMFATARYCRDLEAAFSDMVRRHARGEPARPFAVPAFN